MGERVPGSRRPDARRVLVIEDDVTLTTLLRYNFEQSGYAVDAIDCGIAADAYLEVTSPALVVLDWRLPALSGIEVLRRLRCRRSQVYVPVIMLTANCERDARLRALATGVDAVLPKPFSVRELSDQAARLIATDVTLASTRSA